MPFSTRGFQASGEALGDAGRPGSRLSLDGIVVRFLYVVVFGFRLDGVVAGFLYVVVFGF